MENCTNVKKAPIVDGHFHIWNVEMRSYTFPEKGTPLFKNYLASDIQTEMEKIPIKNGVFVQLCNDGLEEARWLSELSKDYSFIKGIVAGVNFEKPGIEETISNLKYTHPLIVGVRHDIKYLPENYFNTTSFKTGLRYLEENDLCYELLSTPKELHSTIELVKEFPNMKFVIDHIAKPAIKEGGSVEWKDKTKILASFPNVMCKLSGIVTEADLENWTVDDIRPYILHILEQFGASRCIFGSDWPVCTLAGASYSKIYYMMMDILSHLSQDELDGIFGLNAISFYGLKNIDS